MFAAPNALLTIPKPSGIKAKPVITGTAAYLTSNGTIPAHAVGDMIIVAAYRIATVQLIGKPSASGTIPTWNDLDAAASVAGTSNSLDSFYTIATATNHTTGTFSGAGIILIIVIRGQAASPLGGHSEADGGTSTTQVVSPSITLSVNDGSSLLLYIGAHRTSVSAIAAAPSGWTRVQDPTVTGGSSMLPGQMMFLNTKDDSTSAGAMTQLVTASNSSMRGNTIEILAA